MKQIFDIAVSDEKTDTQLLEKINNAGQAILKLALSEGVDIHFHGFSDETMGGQPQLMIECDPEFVENIQQLEGVLGVSLNDGLFATDRDPDIQSYYERQLAL